LGVAFDAKVTVNELRAILRTHPAFEPMTKLELLFKKYNSTVNAKVLFCPKYHCEINAIEGVWCHSKAFVRPRSDQTLQTMKKLIIESRINYVEINLNPKLIKRFWRVLVAYYNGATYQEVIQTYFSGRSAAKNINHQKISISKIDIDE